MSEDHEPSASQRAWSETRRYLNEHRHDLSITAARLYAEHDQVGSTGSADPTRVDAERGDPTGSRRA